jgi:hypothetical protein
LVVVSNPSRSLGLDALRTAAIVGMMAAHTSRLIAVDVRPDWAVWILLLEPIIPSLFLFLVGVSLTWSLHRFLARGAAHPAEAPTPAAWYKRQVRRAAVLWGISAFFYCLEMGPRFPDFLIASGILATIAYALLIVGVLLLLPLRATAIALALAAGTAFFLFLDLGGRKVFPLNAGNAPFLPLWLFALAGALWGVMNRRAPKALFWIGLAALPLAVLLLSRYGLDALFTKPFGRSDAGRVLAAPLTGGMERHAGYYNLRPVLALLCLCLHLGPLSLLGLLARLGPAAARRLSALFTLGRHSLEVYILHLSLLAILVISLGIRPLKTAAQGHLTLLGVLLVSAIWCLWRDRALRRRNGW